MESKWGLKGEMEMIVGAGGFGDDGWYVQS